jgi:hypothetical protein
MLPARHHGSSASHLSVPERQQRATEDYTSIVTLDATLYPGLRYWSNNSAMSKLWI